MFIPVQRISQCILLSKVETNSFSTLSHFVCEVVNLYCLEFSRSS